MIPLSVILRKLRLPKANRAPRRIHPNQRPSPMLILALILAALFSFLPTSALAGPGLPGHWHGTPDPDACNTFNDCIYIFDICYQGHNQTLGSHVADPLQHAVLVDMIGATFGNCPPPPPVPLDLSERCKLLGIDSPIVIGTEHTFTASWLGNIESLQFKGKNGVAYISAVSSPVFIDGKKSASFSAMDSAGFSLLSPGTYQASCIGSDGTLGDSISVTVVR
jgi:hypothetical protein